MLADAAIQALLARAPAAVIFAYLRSPAFLADVLLALVLADARPQAIFAPAPAAVMLAYLQSPAFLAPALDALAGADARDPRHSLHWLLRRSCSHICDPPHSLQ